MGSKKFIFEVYERFEANADDWDKSYIAGAEGCIHGEKGVLRLPREMFDRLSQSDKDSLERKYYWPGRVVPQSWFSRTVMDCLYWRDEYFGRSRK